MTTIARVAVPSPLQRCFDYLVPEPWSGFALRPGQRVRVPFGRGRQVGILLECRSDSPLPAESLKSIEEVLDEEPLLPAELLALADWAWRYYHHPPGEVYASLLPAPLRQGQPARLQVEPRWRLTAAGRSALEQGLARRAPRQQTLLACLGGHPPGLAESELRQELPDCGPALRALRDKGWLEPAPAAPPAGTAAAATVALSAEQAAAVAAVTQDLDRFQSFLLQGVTGSGKTEVYLGIAEAVLARDRQVLLLVPEIGLTPQLLARARAQLPGPLAVLHSGLPERERLNAWLRARCGEARVVIGTRSAVFAPLARPGVILIDEEHDLSFKQQEGFRYHARDLAIVRARQAQIPVLLGSATPALESLYNARQGRYRLLSLPQRVGGAREPRIELLDIRRQPLSEGLSPPLLARMHRHLEQGGQVLLFLNRRGYAPTLLCHECGWLCQCPRCDARLTLHQRRGRLLCHHCGVEQAIPVACPECGSLDLRALGQGTERIEQALAREFPQEAIARIDRDNTRRKGSLEALLEDVHAGRRRILVGTQMLAKGHHFPEITLVGVVDADQSLFSADFRAEERLAQQLLQVAGRAGRAEKPGTVLIQTHQPEHPLLQRLVRQGFDAFAEAALAQRREAVLPPYAYQALLRAEAHDPELPATFLRSALELGQSLGNGVEWLGPVPAPMERRAGRYRAQLLLQATQRPPLHALLAPWIRALAALPLARRVRWSLDVDPQELL